MCETKKTEYSKKDAASFVKRNKFSRSSKGKKLRYYHCNICNCYHLTHNEYVNDYKTEAVELKNENFKKFMDENPDL